jgi:23S rRNA pseudouridine1911/1915/1917 synthase
VYTLICQTDNQRLDKFLAESIPDLSRSQAKRLIDKGLVQVADLKLKASTLLPAGIEVVVTLPAPASQQLMAQAIPLDLVFEDDHLIVVNKPAGLVVHPAAGHAQNTLVNALLHHAPNMTKLHPERPGIVHRLDRDTSGVMVVAKTETALRNLQKQFKTRSVDKTYLALVHGHPTSPEGIIDVPLGRHPRRRQQITPLQEGKPARTHYLVIQTFQAYSLLKIKPETGRTHQIRVHLAWLGIPVVGDKVYGRRKSRLPLSRQFLHAQALAIEHPVTRQRLSFEAPLPEDLQAVLDSIE